MWPAVFNVDASALCGTLKNDHYFSFLRSDLSIRLFSSFKPRDVLLHYLTKEEKFVLLHLISKLNHLYCWVKLLADQNSSESFANRYRNVVISRRGLKTH